MLRFMILFVLLCVILAVSNVAARTKCGAVCAMFCEYGNVLDKNGCPKCECKKQPTEPNNLCGPGRTPLKDYDCGDSSNQNDCPSTYECVNASDGSYSICCSPYQSTMASTQANI